MIDIKVHDGWYVITATKCQLVLSREEFIQALRRGKLLKRQRALQARTPAPITRTRPPRRGHDATRENPSDAQLH